MFLHNSGRAVRRENVSTFGPDRHRLWIEVTNTAQVNQSMIAYCFKSLKFIEKYCYGVKGIKRVLFTLGHLIHSLIVSYLMANLHL